MAKEIHALLPRLISKAGHIFEYHRSVEKALKSFGWDYKAYAPKKTAVSPLPSEWRAVLANDLLESPKNAFLRLKIFISNIFPMRKIFKQIENRDSAVVFIEHFELQHLASIATALFFQRPKFQFWILFRYEFENKRIKALLCRIFLNFMGWKLGSGKLKCLTDSDLLSESLCKNLKRPISVLPIPHTEGCVGGEPKKEGGQIWWWPGGFVREDKGLSKVQHLVSLLKGRDDVRVVAAEKARECFADSSRVCFVSDFLPRDQYVRWMQNADLILLPYLGKAYSQSTSGIFVEAICLGGIPVVTKGTWMAYELQKFSLSLLIFEWDEPGLIDRLAQIRENTDLEIELNRMRSHYRTFHCLSGFAAMAERISRE